MATISHRKGTRRHLTLAGLENRRPSRFSMGRCRAEKPSSSECRKAPQGKRRHPEGIPSELLLTGAALRRRTQVQGVQLLDRGRLNGLNLVPNRGSCRGNDFLTTRNRHRHGDDGRIRQAASISPFGCSEIGKPCGRLAPPTRQAPLLGFLRPQPMMKLTQEIIEIPFLRALVALEGKQGSDFFNGRLHGV